MRIKNIGILHLLSFLELVLLAFLEYRYMQNALNDEPKSTLPLQLAIIGLSVLISAIVFVKKKTLNRIWVLAFVLVALIFFSSFIAFRFYETGTLAEIAKNTFWFFIFSFAYCMALEFDPSKLLLIFFLVEGTVFSVTFIGALQTDFSIVNKNYVLSSIYFLICLIPFVFLIKRIWMQILCLGFFTFLTIMSFKRAALLVLLIALFFLLLANLQKAKKAIARLFFPLLLLGCCALILFFVKIDSFQDILNIWLNRFGGEGSSRLTIQREVLQMIFDSDTLRFGSDTVPTL